MANGEEVKKIYIDGTEYFLSNPMAALQTLPASLVNKIKMFDGKSEEADFSGYDDGKRFRSLNIETKNPNQLKVFGKANLGYGISEDLEDSFKDNNYNLGASANAFNKSKNSPFKEAYVTPIKVPSFPTHNITAKGEITEEKVTPWTLLTHLRKELTSEEVTVVAIVNHILPTPAFKNIFLLKVTKVTYTILNHTRGPKAQATT